MSGIDAMNFAELDTERKKRTGFPEVVFCQGKKDEFLQDIFAKLYAANGEIMGTRATKEQFGIVKSVLANAEYDEVSRIITVKGKEKKLIGNVAVCTAGTADIPVAEEAAKTA